MIEMLFKWLIFEAWRYEVHWKNQEQRMIIFYQSPEIEVYGHHRLILRWLCVPCWFFLHSGVEKLLALPVIDPSTLDLCSRSQVPLTSLARQPLSEEWESTVMPFSINNRIVHWRNITLFLLIWSGQPPPGLEKLPQKSTFFQYFVLSGQTKFLWVGS